MKNIEINTATRHTFSCEAAAAALQEPIYVIYYFVRGAHEVVEGSEHNARCRWAWVPGSGEDAVLYHVFPSGDVYEIART